MWFDWQWAVWFRVKAKLRFGFFFFPLQFDSQNSEQFIILRQTVFSILSISLYLSSQSIIISVSPHWTCCITVENKNRGVQHLKALNKYFIGLVFFVLDWFHRNGINKWNGKKKVCENGISISAGQTRKRWLSNNDKDKLKPEPEQEKKMRKWCRSFHGTKKDSQM